MPVECDQTPTRTKFGSALEQLGLSDEELEALRFQGFVCREDRGGGRGYFRLKFRLRGKQRTRYIGADPARANAIRRDLAKLQASVHRDRRLRQLVKEAQRTLRDGKRRLLPLLEEAGFRFHGLAVRRPSPRR